MATYQISFTTHNISQLVIVVMTSLLLSLLKQILAHQIRNILKDSVEFHTSTSARSLSL
jgi:hypothetical protein